MKREIEFCWVSQVEVEQGIWEFAADCQDTRDHAIDATRSWFAINEMEPLPFQVWRRVLRS
jgi:hypothetical protein